MGMIVRVDLGSPIFLINTNCHAVIARTNAVRTWQSSKNTVSYQNTLS